MLIPDRGTIHYNSAAICKWITSCWDGYANCIGDEISKLRISSLCLEKLFHSELKCISIVYDILICFYGSPVKLIRLGCRSSVWIKNSNLKISIPARWDSQLPPFVCNILHILKSSNRRKTSLRINMTLTFIPRTVSKMFCINRNKNLCAEFLSMKYLMKSTI